MVELKLPIFLMKQNKVSKLVTATILSMSLLTVMAGARLTNGDTAQFTYQEEWVMHDIKLDLDGNTIKTSSREYSWEQMCDRFAIDEKGNHLVKGFQRHILKEDE